VGRPNRDVLVASDQLFVGHDLAIPRANDQLGVFRRTALLGITVADTPRGSAGFRTRNRNAGPAGPVRRCSDRRGYLNLKFAIWTDPSTSVSLNW
jgi:hypothetical protein